MLKLPNVTLVTVGSEKYREQNQKALDYSSKDIAFGSVMNIIHNCDTIDKWNKAIFYDLGDWIQTEYALLVHPDGFVVNPDAWRPEFLDYDYVGAPWPLPTDDYSYRDRNGEIIRVGNSVSLRSKKLLELPKKLDLEWQSFYGNTNEDGAVCVNYRHYFLEAGMTFAPLDVAKYFSHETMIPEVEGIKPFAFHKHAGTNSIYPNFEV